MLTLTIRTDKPESEIGLFDNQQQLAYETWTAHRQLAETIHSKIEALLKNRQKNYSDIQGLVCFKGPGSFTGLRIGLSVSNALAYSLSIPVIASAGEQWKQQGIERLRLGENEIIALPEYGGSVYTTVPKKIKQLRIIQTQEG